MNQQPGTKSGHRPADVPPVKRFSHAFCDAYLGSKRRAGSYTQSRIAFEMPPPQKYICIHIYIYIYIQLFCLYFYTKYYISCICRIQNPDIPRAGRVGAAHGGAAGRGGAGQHGTPTDRFAQEITVLRTLQGTVCNCSERFFLNDSSEARTSEIPCKPIEEQKPRLTSGLYVVRQLVFVPGCRPLYRRPSFVRVNHFHARHIRELLWENTCRIQNTVMPRAGRGWAVHGEVARRCGVGRDAVVADGRFSQYIAVPLAPRGIVDNYLERFFGSTDKGNPI